MPIGWMWLPRSTGSKPGWPDSESRESAVTASFTHSTLWWWQLWSPTS